MKGGLKWRKNGALGTQQGNIREKYFTQTKRGKFLGDGP